MEKDQALQEKLGEAKLLNPQQFSEAPSGTKEEPLNLNHWYYKLEKTIGEVFRDQFVKSQKPIPENPLRTFLLRNAQHPRIDALITALGNQQHEIANRLIGQISADGWRSFLKGV